MKNLINWNKMLLKKYSTPFDAISANKAAQIAAAKILLRNFLIVGSGFDDDRLDIAAEIIADVGMKMSAAKRIGVQLKMSIG